MPIAQDFFAVVTPNATTFSALPQVSTAFEAPEWDFYLRTGAAGAVDFSFDGVNVHGTLDTAERPALTRPRSAGRNVVWFKSAAGSESVEVSAWIG